MKAAVSTARTVDFFRMAAISDSGGHDMLWTWRKVKLQEFNYAWTVVTILTDEEVLKRIKNHTLKPGDITIVQYGMKLEKDELADFDIQNYIKKPL